MNTPETQSGIADYRSEWRDKELWWIINGKPVSDAVLRSWCYAHLEYPWCYVDVVRAYHVNAWADERGADSVSLVRRGQEMKEAISREFNAWSNVNYWRLEEAKWGERVKDLKTNP